MLKNNYFYEEKANKTLKDATKAVKEVKRLLATMELTDIDSIEEKGSFTSSGVTSYYYIEHNNKVYITDNMNKNTFRIFNEILPLHKSDKIGKNKEPLITKGLLKDVKNPDKVFRKF